MTAREPEMDVATATGSPMGTQIRKARTAQGMTLRELARRINVTPSFVSQLERNKVNASVGTLYNLVNALGMSLDELMTTAADTTSGEETLPAPAPAPVAPPVPADRTPASALDQFPALGWDPGAERWPRIDHPVQPSGSRARIRFPGVIWERLTQDADPFVDFLHVEYTPGSASCPEDEMMRHGGREYGYVLSGRLDIQVGFDTHVLEPGDAITFDSMTPHRLSNPFEENCQAIWFVVARRSDDRSTELVEPSSNVTHLPSIHP